MLRILNQIWSAPTHLGNSDLATPICAAGRPCCLLTWKRGHGLWHSAQIWLRREEDDHAHCDLKDLCIFFTELDRSRLTNLDRSRSRFVRFWKRMQPLSSYAQVIYATSPRKKLCQCYFLNNSVKHWPNLIHFYYAISRRNLTLMTVVMPTLP